MASWLTKHRFSYWLYTRDSQSCLLKHSFVSKDNSFNLQIALESNVTENPVAPTCWHRMVLNINGVIAIYFSTSFIAGINCYKRFVQLIKAQELCSLWHWQEDSPVLLGFGASSNIFHALPTAFTSRLVNRWLLKLTSQEMHAQRTNSTALALFCLWINSWTLTSDALHH
jgi:hypothetical protein